MQFKIVSKPLSLLKQQNKIGYNFAQGYHFRSEYNPYLKIAKTESDKIYDHRVWSKEEVENCPTTIRPRESLGDHFAYYGIQTLRTAFDYASGYTKIFPWQNKTISEKTWLYRVLFLETVAGIPGFVGAMVRHIRSIRKMRKDQGWIHTLLEEAENERFHLVTFLKLYKPGPFFKLLVIGGQVGWTLIYSTLYLISARTAHRMVGYLEEQAVITYSHCISEIKREGSPIHHWASTPAPPTGIKYWQLPEDATLLDLVLAVRKDEEHHKDVNHDLGNDYTQNQPNPYPPGM